MAATLGKQLPKLLVIGGGPSGNTLAGYLSSKANVSTVLVQEKHKHIKNFPLWLWDDSLSVLRDMGLQNKVKPLLTEIDTRHYFDHSGNSLSSQSLYDRCLVTPSRELSDLLIHGLKKGGTDYREQTHLNDIQYSDDGDKVKATFDDDTTETFDFVVGAEGVARNAQPDICTRNFMYPKSQTFFPNTNVFIGVTIAPHYFDQWFLESLPSKEMWMYRNQANGDQVSMMNYKCRLSSDEITRNYFIQFKVDAGTVAEADAMTKMTTSELVAFVTHRFGGYAGVVPWALQGLLNNSTDDSELEMDKFVSATVDTHGPWHKNRVAIIGDAAHANRNWMDGSQAIDDAQALGDALNMSIDKEDSTKFNATDLEFNLKRFDIIRQHEIEKVNNLSMREDPFGFYTTGRIWKLKHSLFLGLDSLSDYIGMFVSLRPTLVTPSEDWYHELDGPYEDDSD